MFRYIYIYSKIVNIYRKAKMNVVRTGKYIVFVDA